MLENRSIDSEAIAAKTNSQALDIFINKYESYILKCASNVSNRYISKSHDEWSIALIAFNQAIENYDMNKGSFLSFAKLVIRRRLIDYYRSQSKFNQEIPVRGEVFDTGPADEDDKANLSVKLAVADKVSTLQNKDIKYEIDEIKETFARYNITFQDLSKCSPKASRTRKSCAKAVNYILDNPILLNDLKETQLLPTKIIEKNTGVPRKTIERHRKYIIAAVEILSGSYPHLAEYMNFIREENDK